MKITHRQYRFGPHHLTADSQEAAEAPYVIAGPRLYAIGRASGLIGPIGAEHLLGEMGGIWAHPLRVADGLAVTVRDEAGRPMPCDAGVFTESPAEVSWAWTCGALCVSRRDRVLPTDPAYAIMLSLANEGHSTTRGTLEVTAHLTFRGCWFGGLASDGGHYQAKDTLILGQDGLQATWGIALGTPVPPDEHQITPGPRGAVATLGYHYTLEPGASRSWLLLLTVANSGGVTEAKASWLALIDNAGTHFTGDDTAILTDLPSIKGGTEDLERDFAIAQANLRLLETDYPALEPYFLAGLPEYPQLFGCDTTYTVPGAVGAGFAATCRSALMTLARYAERACGRIPHEITTNGRVFHPGNIQETPQFTIAVWDYLRWTGDLNTARLLFPLCREGMLDLIPTVCGIGGRYPYGDGMIERLGMGSRKLDSACYTIAGLRALANLAAALGEPDTMAYLSQADDLNAAFERDWWLEDEGLYADSMHSDGRLQLDGHWTVVLPVQLGLAAPARARRVMARIEAEFVNQWGLVHTRAHEELVWTLPTGLLALAAFQQGNGERGLQLTRNIALSTHHGTLGTFKELIPEGLCFIQLWSAGLYLQSLLEGLLGLQPDAPAHRLSVAPHFPPTLSPVTLHGLHVGAHRLNLTVAAGGLDLEHVEGPRPLDVTYAGTTRSVAPGATLRQTP